MTKTHCQKIAAAVCVAIFLILYYSIYAYIFFTAAFEMNFILGLLFFILPILLLVGIVYVFIERLKEIERGEEDDLDNY